MQVQDVTVDDHRSHNVQAPYHPVLPGLQKLCFLLQWAIIFSLSKKGVTAEVPGTKNKMLPWSEETPVFSVSDFLIVFTFYPISANFQNLLCTQYFLILTCLFLHPDTS